MAILQLASFDLLTARPMRTMASQPFWLALTKICPGTPEARILMIADVLRPRDLLDGFERVTTPWENLPPSITWLRLNYEDHLRGANQNTRYMRVYLVIHSRFDDERLIRVLRSYGIRAFPINQSVPRAFDSGLDEWDHIRVAQSGGQAEYWGVLESRNHQAGSFNPYFFHAALAQEFPVFAALHVSTLKRPEAQRLLREKEGQARFSDKNTAQDVSDAKGAATAAEFYYSELNNNLAIHDVKCYMMTSAPNLRTLDARLTVMRTITPFEMSRAYKPGPLVERLFSSSVLGVKEGTLMTTPGVAILAGSALSYRRRTDTRGVLVGMDQNQAPVVMDLFDPKNPSYNAVILGQTGYGKTFFLLLLIIRNLLMGIRSIIVDPQGNIDLRWMVEPGLYQRAVMGTSTAKINIFRVNQDELGGQVDIVMSLCGMLKLLEIRDPLERSIMDEALMEMYAPLWERYYHTKEELQARYLREDKVSLSYEVEEGEFAPIPSDEQPDFFKLRDWLTKHSGKTAYPQSMRDRMQAIAYRLRMCTEGSLAKLFGAEDTLDFSLNPLVNIYDVSRLPSKQLGGNLRTAIQSVLVANINQSIRWRRRQRSELFPNGDTVPIIFLVDEIGIMMRDEVMASYVSSEYKTARSRFVSMIVADQDAHSLLGPRDTQGVHHGEPILANSAFTFLFRQKDAQRETMRSLFPAIPGAMIDGLAGLEQGTCIAQFPDDLCILSVLPSALEEVLLSSKLTDRKRMAELMKAMAKEFAPA